MTAAGVTVRPIAGRDDARAAQVIDARAWRAAYDDILPASALPDEAVDEAGVREFRERYRDADDATCFVAERRAVDGADGEPTGEEDRIVGSATVEYGAGRKAYAGDDDADLRAIYVDPDWWGEGVGTALLEAVEADLPDWVRRLVLEALVGNEVGERFYRRRGFAVVDEHAHEIAGETYPTRVWAKSV